MRLLLLGATGLVGRNALAQALAQPAICLTPGVHSKEPKRRDWGNDESSECFAIREESGGRGETRTPDPLLAKQVLCQLSYTPTAETSFDVKAFAAVRKLRKPIMPSACQNCLKAASSVFQLKGQSPPSACARVLRMPNSLDWAGPERLKFETLRGLKNGSQFHWARRAY